LTLSTSEPNTAQLVLYQFAFSHFNEKVRWALDWKGLDSNRRNLLPGFHARTTKKLTGSAQTPVLVIDDEAIAGSTAILHRLEALQPSPALFSADPKTAEEIEQWIDWLDDEVGPAIRLGLFDELLADPKCAAAIFSVGHSGLKRMIYAVIFPRIIPVLRSRMSITAANAAQANKLTLEALDRIADATEATGYLVGDHFTAADLTAASLFFPLSFPAQLPFSMPTRPSAALAHWKARWQDHRAIAWTEEIFRKHR